MNKSIDELMLVIGIYVEYGINGCSMDIIKIRLSLEIV